MLKKLFLFSIFVFIVVQRQITHIHCTEHSNIQSAFITCKARPSQPYYNSAKSAEFSATALCLQKLRILSTKQNLKQEDLGVEEKLKDFFL